MLKERSQVKSPNYIRFYEFDSSVNDICQACPANQGSDSWKALQRRVLGAAVHTNWPRSGAMKKVSKIYICESPSDKESSHGFPSVGATGRGIFERQYGDLREGWLDLLDEKIYRTNIVRCQADAGLQKRVNATLKNQRVRSAFQFCSQHLSYELDHIFRTSLDQKITSLSFVIAVGHSFPMQIRSVQKLIDEFQLRYGINAEVIIRNHPSTIHQDN